MTPHQRLQEEGAFLVGADALRGYCRPPGRGGGKSQASADKCDASQHHGLVG